MRKLLPNTVAVVVLLLLIASFARVSNILSRSHPHASPSPTEAKSASTKARPPRSEERPGPQAVVVETLDKPLPTDEAAKERFLWDSFANKPEEGKFDSYSTADWERNFADFSAALVSKADSQRLDAVSLRQILDLVLKDSGGLAYLPVGAYQATSNGKPVWIVTVKWESPGMGDSPCLGHIRVFVFEQKTLKRVGFITCG